MGNDSIGLADRLRTASFYNLYPVVNEVHTTAFEKHPEMLEASRNPGLKEEGLFVDELTGRVFGPEMRNVPALYGRSALMSFYSLLAGLTVVEELRVPYRRIPVYKVDSLRDLKLAVSEVSGNSHHLKPLLRGQNTLYLTEWRDTRSPDSFEQFYGELVKEPSFLPSFFRQDFDELTIRNIWHSQASYILNDVGVDLESRLTESQWKEYLKDSMQVRFGPHMDFFALAIAQHYGLPSIGLDLSDQLEVALWFALHTIRTQSGKAEVGRIGPGYSPTLFVFFCPEAAVFDYDSVRPVHFAEGRPDRQRAWFCHVGWGMARNQLANYLACAFRLDESFLEDLPEELTRHLFPSRDEDPTLDAFLNQKDNSKFRGEVKRALDCLYEVV